MCDHYNRNCNIISPCCGNQYSCRLCHDIKENYANINFTKKKLKWKPKYKIKEIIKKLINTNIA